MTKRADSIRAKYRLEQDGDTWRAVSLFRGEVFSTIEDNDRDTVVRKARREWGHFNFRDEAVAFNEIFPPQGARS